MASENSTHGCPYHVDHAHRIEGCEKSISVLNQECEGMKEKIGSPAIAVAVIGLIGVLFTASAAFAGVVAAPVVQGVLRGWGWM
jgi:hypothetical protein